MESVNGKVIIRIAVLGILVLGEIVRQRQVAICPVLVVEVLFRQTIRGVDRKVFLAISPRHDSLLVRAREDGRVGIAWGRVLVRVAQLHCLRDIDKAAKRIYSSVDEPTRLFYLWLLLDDITDVVHAALLDERVRERDANGALEIFLREYGAKINGILLDEKRVFDAGRHIDDVRLESGKGRGSSDDDAYCARADCRALQIKFPFVCFTFPFDRG